MLDILCFALHQVRPVPTSFADNSLPQEAKAASFSCLVGDLELRLSATKCRIWHLPCRLIVPLVCFTFYIVAYSPKYVRQSLLHRGQCRRLLHQSGSSGFVERRSGTGGGNAASRLCCASIFCAHVRDSSSQSLKVSLPSL